MNVFALRVWPGRWAVCRLAPDDAVPTWATVPAPLSVVARSESELSVLVPEAHVPDQVTSERGLRVIEVVGPVPFAVTGLIASLSQPVIAKVRGACAGFGLSAHELDLIRSLPAHSRCFLIRHANHSVVARLDLAGMPELLLVLSGRESTVRRLDAIRANVGDDPAHWYPLLTRAPWPGGPDADDDVLYIEAAE